MIRPSGAPLSIIAPDIVQRAFSIQFNSIQFIVTKQSCTQIEQSLNSNRICDNEDETQGVCVLSLLQPNI